MVKFLEPALIFHTRSFAHSTLSCFVSLSLSHHFTLSFFFSFLSIVKESFYSRLSLYLSHSISFTFQHTKTGRSESTFNRDSTSICFQLFKSVSNLIDYIALNTNGVARLSIDNERSEECISVVWTFSDYLRLLVFDRQMFHSLMDWSRICYLRNWFQKDNSNGNISDTWIVYYWHNETYFRLLFRLCLLRLFHSVVISHATMIPIL